jgi:hypothetical protein
MTKEDINDEKNKKKTERIQQALTAMGREMAKWVIYDRTVKLDFEVNISQGNIAKVNLETRGNLLK